MSYENPQLSFADPLAFSKGFQQTFSYFQEEYKKEKEEKDRIAKEQDDALAKAYSASDVSGIAGIDTKLRQGLQDSIDSVINNGDFANAKASEQALMLRKVSSIKSTVARLGELVAIPADEWDARNSPKISQLRNSLISGDPDIQVSGEGLDLKITGKFGTVSLEELASAQFRNKNEYKAELDAINTAFKQEAGNIFKTMSQTDVDLDQITETLKALYKKRLSALDPEMLSAIYSNEGSSAVHDANNSFIFNDPKRTSAMSPEEASVFKQNQINSLFEDLATRELGSVYDWGEAQGFYKEVQALKQRQEQSKLSLDWAKLNLEREKLEKNGTSGVKESIQDKALTYVNNIKDNLEIYAKDVYKQAGVSYDSKAQKITIGGKTYNLKDKTDKRDVYLSILKLRFDFGENTEEGRDMRRAVQNILDKELKTSNSSGGGSNSQKGAYDNLGS